MIKVSQITECRFGAKADRSPGCHVRGGLLSFDIRRYPALLLREPSGALGGLLFNDANRLKAQRTAQKQLEAALARFARAGVEPGHVEGLLVGGSGEDVWHLEAWRAALRKLGMHCQENDVLGSYYRQVFFDVTTGRADVFREAACAAQGNPGKAALSLADSTQVFRESDARGVVANATRFFREAKSFQALKEWIVPEHLQLRPDTPFVLWSACCSNGAESYSYAMYLHRLFQRLGAGCPMRVVGTDINETLIETARKGAYQVKPDEWQEFRPYFEHYADVKGDKIVFREEIRRFVTFRPHDIKKPPRKHRFQVIVCANVFQYYKDDAREHFLCNFASALDSPGYVYAGVVRPEIAERAGLEPLGRYGMLFKP